MKIKTIPATIAAVLALAAGVTHAQTAPQVRLEMGVVTKSVTELNTAANRKNLYLVVEGAGKFSAEGKVTPVYVLCGAVDTLVQGHKTVYQGIGDCEFKTVAGGILYGRFQTPEGKGDRGYIKLSGGTKDLERFNGSEAPMIAIINPHLVGKTVFYFDSADEKLIGQ